MLSQGFIWVALAITIGGNIFYLLDTLKGKTKPNRVTFFLWGAAPLVGYFAQRSGGGGQQILFTLTIGTIPLVILAASFVDKKAYWAITKFDLACGALSLVALVFLISTGNAVASLFLSVMADLLACLPTIIKAYKHPETETAIAYVLEILSSLIILLTIKHWLFINYFFALYVLLTNVLFAVLLLFPRKEPYKKAL